MTTKLSKCKMKVIVNWYWRNTNSCFLICRIKIYAKEILLDVEWDDNDTDVFDFAGNFLDSYALFTRNEIRPGIQNGLHGNKWGCSHSNFVMCEQHHRNTSNPLIIGLPSWISLRVNQALIYWIQLCFIAGNFHSDYLSSHNWNTANWWLQNPFVQEQMFWFWFSSDFDFHRDQDIYCSTIKIFHFLKQITVQCL